MDEMYREEAEQLIDRFGLPRDSPDPLKAEIERLGFSVEPSFNVDASEGHQHVIRLRSSVGSEVSVGSGGHVKQARTRALARFLEREKGHIA